jgi:hypothetical protein
MINGKRSRILEVVAVNSSNLATNLYIACSGSPGSDANLSDPREINSFAGKCSGSRCSIAEKPPGEPEVDQ